MQGRNFMRLTATLLFAALALSGAAHAQSTPPAASAPKFIAISNNAILSSRLMGLKVQSASGETMGRIEDVVFEGGQISGVVLAVGEALGAGERYVAVDPSGISIRYMEAEDKWEATINASLDQMKAAPEFRYEGKWKR
jgi:sporulation protein YlmC with PRC-barrel domain